MTTAKQEVLFDRQPAAWELDDQADQRFAEVVFDRPVDQTFFYQVPPALFDQLTPGKRVAAPFGRASRRAVGYCVALHTTAPRRELKEILSVIDDEPLLNPAMLRLTRWMADYYACRWGQVLDAIVPAGVKRQAGTRVTTFLEVPAELRDRAAELKFTSAKQRRAFELLADSADPMTPEELARLARCTLSPIRGLRLKGVVRVLHRRVAQTLPADFDREPPPDFHPNRDQERALRSIADRVAAGGFHAFLLHGVTGSGKTEVYLRAIEKVLGAGRTSIVLVPEISLTPQTIRRFAGRFPKIAVLHSHLTDAQRHLSWREIARGEVQVVVGARSAIFAPTGRLGIIIIDEEHEHSFKQEQTPRYHARDVAVMRARLEGVPIILGSATPSLESWHNAEKGKYELLTLPTRVLERPLPKVSTIDLRHTAPPKRGFRALSEPLEHAMRRALADGGQVILLLNRRGYSTYIHCPRCGYVEKCPHCDITLTYHRGRGVSICHYCDLEKEPPPACPECFFPALWYQGLGTERLEAEIKAKFPDYPCRRMDSDTMRSSGAHNRVLSAFHSGAVRILLGTQMIAKGLDFPNVTLVGVVNADTALHLADFRARERTFQLVAQVAGRTGRGERGGRVLVQTLQPEDPAIATAVHHDYLTFAREELRHRREFGYPPYTRMLRIIVRSTHEPHARDFATTIAETLNAHLASITPETPTLDSQLSTLNSGSPPLTTHHSPLTPVRLLGPAPAPISKLKKFHRHHLQLLAPRSFDLSRFTTSALAKLAPPKGVQYAIDVDPLNML